MHERRSAEREYSCNECGEVFRNIFPFQDHMRDFHQVGGGKRTKTSTRRTKRRRTDQPGMYKLKIFRLLTLYLYRYFFSFKEQPTSSTRVNEGKRVYTV